MQGKMKLDYFFLRICQTAKSLLQIKKSKFVSFIIQERKSWYPNIGSVIAQFLWSQGGQVGYTPNLHPGGQGSTPSRGNQPTKKN